MPALKIALRFDNYSHPKHWGIDISALKDNGKILRHNGIQGINKTRLGHSQDERGIKRTDRPVVWNSWAVQRLQRIKEALKYLVMRLSLHQSKLTQDLSLALFYPKSKGIKKSLFGVTQSNPWKLHYDFEKCTDYEGKICYKISHPRRLKPPSPTSWRKGESKDIGCDQNSLLPSPHNIKLNVDSEFFFFFQGVTNI